nr:MAG TPA: hypothetical protein [Caudoviricetes sp.]
MFLADQLYSLQKPPFFVRYSHYITTEEKMQQVIEEGVRKWKRKLLLFQEGVTVPGLSR